MHVSTARADVLAPLLIERLREAGAMVHCNVMTDRDGCQVMFLVVEPAQISLLAQIVRVQDPGAYVVVLDAVEFYGGGMATAPQEASSARPQPAGPGRSRR